MPVCVCRPSLRLATAGCSCRPLAASPPVQGPTQFASPSAPKPPLCLVRAQEARPLAVHRAAAAAGSRRQRGVGAWAATVAEATALPAGQAGAELAVVLEFLQARCMDRRPFAFRSCSLVFASAALSQRRAAPGCCASSLPSTAGLCAPVGPSLQVFGPKLQLRAPCLAAFAAELLQPAAAEGGGQLLCPAEEESLVGAVHCRLLELVSPRISATPFPVLLSVLEPCVPATLQRLAALLLRQHTACCCRCRAAAGRSEVCALATVPPLAVPPRISRAAAAGARVLERQGRRGPLRLAGHHEGVLRRIHTDIPPSAAAALAAWPARGGGGDLHAPCGRQPGKRQARCWRGGLRVWGL